MSYKKPPLLRDSSAAELNTDLILEILLRSPAKSLIRFKLVSKLWFSLISDPQFCLSHTRRNPSNSPPSGLFFYDSLTKSQEIELVSLTSHSRVPPLDFLGNAVVDGGGGGGRGAAIKIVQSCNGLVLCCLTSFNPKGSISRNYCVCNPTTKQYRILPQIDATSKASVIVGLSLAFDPSASPHYKVICVRQFKPYAFLGGVNLGGSASRTCQMDIYSSEHQTWRPFTYHFCPPNCMSFEGGIFCNGAIHWGNNQCFSLCFDVNVEEFTRIPMPPMPESDRRGSCRYFGGCGNHLHFIKICQPSTTKFCVLEMRKDYSKWDIKYRVSVCRLVSAFPEIVRTTSHRGFEETGYVFSVLCVVKGLKEEDSSLVLTIPGKVISYNFLHKTVKALRELPPGQIIEPFKFNSVSAYPYIETLSLV